MTTLTQPKKKAATRPPDRWRNWWLSEEDFWCVDRERDIDQGEVYCGRSVWPSKEVAEMKALSAPTTVDGYPVAAAIYLGAYPEGERP